MTGLEGSLLKEMRNKKGVKKRIAENMKIAKIRQGTTKPNKSTTDAVTHGDVQTLRRRSRHHVGFKRALRSQESVLLAVKITFTKEGRGIISTNSILVIQQKIAI